MDEEKINENNELKSEKSITIKKGDIWKYSTFLLLAVVVIMAIFSFAGKEGVTGGATITGGTTYQPGALAFVQVGESPLMGDSNAQLTLIEFSDYQCPFCRKFWSEALPLIKSNFIDTGKINFVYKDLPLESIHPSAVPAAEATKCVREQGGDKAYFEMHDKIFSEQNILDGGDPINGPVRGTVQFGTTELKQWAKEIGYNIDSCLDSRKFRSDVQKDLAEATSAGGQGTPYFVIITKGENKGNPISGACPYSTFEQAFNAELNGQNWAVSECQFRLI